MKKIFIIILFSISINAEISQTMIEEAMMNGFKQAGKGILNASDSMMRRATNTRTAEQICNSKQIELQKRSSKYWWDTRKENQKMMKILRERKIDYYTILKQIRNQKIDLVKLKKESCSEKYFNYALQRKEEDNKMKTKNETLVKLIKINGLKIKTKSIYKQTKIEEKKEYKKLNMTITENKNLDEEMKKAMLDVN